MAILDFRPFSLPVAFPGLPNWVRERQSSIPDLARTRVALGETFGNRFLLVLHPCLGGSSPAERPFWADLARWACHSGPRVDDTLHVWPSASPERMSFLVIGGDGEPATCCANGLLYAASQVSVEPGLNGVDFVCGAELRPVSRSGAGWRADLGAAQSLPVRWTAVPGLLRKPVFIRIGEPHAVSFIEDLADRHLPFSDLGRAICESFGAAGINWNLASCDGAGLHIRTFERGVRRPTTSCGTGAAASFHAARVTGRLTAREAVVACAGGDHHVSLVGEHLRISGQPAHHAAWRLGDFLDSWPAG